MDRDPANAARARFRDRFGRPPEGVAFAPGRVNLIGEHVDYCGLPVLPAALARGVALAFGARPDSRIRCATTEPGHPETRFAIGGAPPAGFGRYLAAGALACGDPGPGFDGFLASDLPAASGLSSSSALVVATALALHAVRGREPPARERLAIALAEAEHRVALAGGAMDQSICLGARPGHALAISFDPPAWRPVPIDPAPVAFLVAFSGERAEKGGAAGAVFDARGREAKEALRLAGLPRNRLGTPAALARAAALPRPLDGRLRHLASEARRTAAAERCLREGDAPGLGALLDGSHRSLRDDYGVSTPELDALVAEARRGGALGARLTGAGLGGSVVILSLPERRAAVRSRLRERFFAPRGVPDPDGTHLLDGTPAGPAELLPGE